MSFGDGKWRMIDSLGTALIGGGGGEGKGGRNAGTVRIALSKNSEIRVGSRLCLSTGLYTTSSLLLAPLFSVRLKLAIN